VAEAIPPLPGGAATTAGSGEPVCGLSVTAAASGSKGRGAGTGRLAVAVVSYNTRDLLRDCLASVRDAGVAEVVVVDNASTDGSAEMVRGEFPHAALVANRGNPGYGAAANQAVAHCAAPYVLLLNSDTTIAADAPAALAEYLDRHARVGVLGPRLLNRDGTLQRSCYPFPGTARWLLDNNSVAAAGARVPRLRRALLRTWAHDHARAVPFVKGAALALRRSAFEEVGGFDPGYFMYAEEVDLSYRLWRRGWETHFAPVTEVVHLEGQSSQQQRTRMAVQHVASELRFFHTHYGGRRARALTLLLRAHAGARWARSAVLLALARASVDRPRLREEMAAWRHIVRGDFGPARDA
jgi:GT2 family glycosyltransferase